MVQRARTQILSGLALPSSAPRSVQGCVKGRPCSAVQRILRAVVRQVPLLAATVSSRASRTAVFRVIV